MAGKTAYFPCTRTSQIPKLNSNGSGWRCLSSPAGLIGIKKNHNIIQLCRSQDKILAVTDLQVRIPIVLEVDTWIKKPLVLLFG